MSGEVPAYPVGGSSSSFLLELILETLRSPERRRKLIIALVFIVGVYLVIANAGEMESRRVKFVGHNIQGYGWFTTGTFTVYTDPRDKELTEFKVFIHSIGTWRPEFDYEDTSGWYVITYRKTLIGNKLITVEPTN
ncbi:MAG: hypothetical protein NWF07_14275 [Candidatus Bathyarchaeota archaeon]|nr:hypothetical protein [Candidatus Bathyarchaeota archaeon]